MLPSFTTLRPTQRFLAGIVVAMIVCFGIQGLAFYKFDAAALKAESNYYSSLGRIQRARAPSACIALIGSSITGRMPGREAGNLDVANLGADGGSPLDGMELLQERIVAQPGWVVVEVNTLFNQIGFKRVPVVAGAKGLWFRIGAEAPLLGASARPSGMLYSKLLNRGRYSMANPFPVPDLPRRFTGPEAPPAGFSEPEAERLEILVRGLKELQSRRVRLLLVNYPASIMSERESGLMMAAVSRFGRETGACFLDLSKDIPRDQLVFTDPVHLGPESAARVLETIRQTCASLDGAD